MSEQTGERSREYNYEHFMPATLIKDAQLIRDPEGPHPGDLAPDFSLKDTTGSR